MTIFCLGTRERTRKEMERDLEAEETSKGVRIKLEARLSSPTRSPGAGRTKTDAQVAYVLRLGRSLYGWKAKKITFPTDLRVCLFRLFLALDFQKKPKAKPKGWQ